MYGLTRVILGPSPFLELTENEYRDALRATHCLRETLEIEEKFDLVLSNYQEFETELLQIALRATMYFENDWSASVGTFQTVNRRIVNVLTTCRLYLDQIGHNISSLYGADSDVARAVQRARSFEYDSRLGYRTMEALRNYVQHRGLPVHGMSLEGRWIDEAEHVRRHMRQTVSLRVSVSKLKEDAKFKADVLAELEGISEEHDLKMMVRDYLGGLGCVQVSLRELLAADVRMWDATVEALIERYHAAGGDTLGLGLVRREERVLTQHAHILDDPISRRKQLQQKNHQTKHYTRAVVTNY